jgi:putative ABC transport system permease protein
VLLSILDAVRAGMGERRARRRGAGWGAVTGLDAWPGRARSGSHLVADVRQAARLYARRPLVAVCVTAVIAIGIAATTAVFSIIDGVLLRPLPWHEPERVVWLQVTRGADTPGMANPLDVADWREQAQSFSEVAAFGTYEITMQVDEAVRVGVAEVSEGFDRVLGVRALHGRLLAEEDYVPEARSVVVSHELWREQLGADPAAVGRSILLDERPFTVVGVLPDLPLRFPLERAGVWTALQLPAPGDPSTLSRAGVWLWALARLAPGIDRAGAGMEMRHLAARLRERYPQSNRERDVNTLPIRDLIVGPVRPGLLLLAAAVALVLLVATANVGNLLLVTAHGRRQELAVRATLGAGRARLARQVLTESTVLAAVGAGLGLVLAPAALRVLLANYPGGLPRAAAVGIHMPGLLVAVAAMLLAALGAALPGLHQTRRLDLHSTIGSGARGGETRADQRVRSALVAAQVALSIVLLFAGAVLWRSFDHLNRTETGFAAENLLSFNLALSSTRYGDAAAEAAMHAQLLERIRALPGVRAAGTSTLLPFAAGEFIDGFVREGHPGDAPPDMPAARLQNITPGFVEALGLQLVAGRTFTDADRAGAAPVVVVNRELERRYFPEGALGRRIDVRGVLREIVGIVSDKRHADVRADYRAELYVPKAQSDWPRLLAWVTVRTARNPLQLLPAIRDIVTDLDPAASVDDARTMDARLASTLAPDRFRTLCVVTLSAAAALLALLGLWGLVGYSVARQTREIGIRMALGEAPAGALRRVLLDALRIAAVGAMAGVLLSLAGAQLLEGFVAGVEARDLPTLIVVAIAFLCAAVFAAVGPARRASAVAPGVSIRHD